MPEYVDFPIETDPDLIEADVMDEIRGFFPSFDPAETSLAKRGISALCQMIAESRDVAAAPVPSAIFRAAGTTLYGIPAVEATPATADTTWVARDSAGYGPIPEGTIVSIEGELFETTDIVSWPSGVTTVGPIGIKAINEGLGGSDLGTVSGTVDLEEGYEYVASITQAAPTSGGIDSEDVDGYQDRLVGRLQLRSDVAILGKDLAKQAKTVLGVERVLVLDNFDYDTLTPNVAGVATIVPIDSLGAILPSLKKDEIRSLITADNRRLLNGTLYVVDPTYHDIDVSGTVVAYPGADLVAAKEGADAAVAFLLDPANWGQPPSGEQRLWLPKSVVAQFDVIGALDQVELIDTGSVSDIEINGVAGDYTMSGVGPLPRPGDIDITVVAP